MEEAFYHIVLNCARDKPIKAFMSEAPGYQIPANSNAVGKLNGEDFLYLGIIPKEGTRDDRLQAVWVGGCI